MLVTFSPESQQKVLLFQFNQSLQENKRIEQKSLLVAKINECLQFVLYLLALYDDMQGMVTRVLARLGGKHEAPSQCGEHISCK